MIPSDDYIVTLAGSSHNKIMADAVGWADQAGAGKSEIPVFFLEKIEAEVTRQLTVNGLGDQDHDRVDVPVVVVADVVASVRLLVDECVFFSTRSAFAGSPSRSLLSSANRVDADWSSEFPHGRFSLVHLSHTGGKSARGHVIDKFGADFALVAKP